MSRNNCTLAIIGDGSVGKSTIISAFRAEGFQKVYKQTIGCDFYEKQLVVRNSETISLRVWDIGGQSISSKNLPGYLSNSTAVMLVYDVTNKQSFDNLQDWITQLKKYNPDISYIYLLGNKVDLIALRQVSEIQHFKFINDNDLTGGIFVSAKTGENIVRMFHNVAAESIGIKLTEYELAYYDKVLTAYVAPSDNQQETRNAWADDIEKEDMEAEKRKQQAENGCACSIS